MSTIKLTIVTPVYNEEKTIQSFLDELYAVLDSLKTSFEVICVDDGSRDRSAEILEEEKRSGLKVLHLSRNFGHQAALLAGIEHARGEVVVTLDSDLQHPPDIIPLLIQKHSDGADVVLTQRIDSSKTSIFKKFSAHAFYAVMNTVTSNKLLHNGSDFRSLNRKAVNALLAMPEKRKFLRGMVQWIGFTQVVIPFTVRDRSNGESKYTLLKMLKLAVHGVTSFSTLPLYLSVIFAVILFVLATIYALYVLYIRLFTGAVVEGWASVLFVQLCIGGFLSLFVALLGIYIAAIYDEVKNRPLYILKDIHESDCK